MSRENLNKKLNDAFLSSIGEAHIQNIDEMTKNNEKWDMTEMDVWFDDFIASYKRDNKKNNFKRKMIRVIRIAAMVIITIAITFTGLFTGVEAFRVKILNLVISDNDTHVLISNNNLNDLRDQGVVLPETLSDGMTLYSYESIGNMHKTIFMDDQKHFINILQASIETQIQFDTENADVINLTVEQLEIAYIRKDDVYTFYWYDDRFNYSIVSNLSYDILIKIINSMK